MLTKKTAIITGGSKGIGYGIAKSLLQEGVNVVITSRSLDAAEKAAASLNKMENAKAIGLAADVRKLSDQEEVVKQTISTFGGVDFVIANAGLGHFAPIDELTEAQWNETIDTNLTGVFFTLKASVEALKVSKGYFISISSLAGTNFFPNGAAYNASKFGVTGFTQAAMLDLRNYGIKLSTIMPGSVASHFNANEPGEKDSWKIQPEDIGEIVVDLFKMHPRTLPSKIEVRPTLPPQK